MNNTDTKDKDGKKYLSPKEQAELLKKALSSLDDDMDIFKNLTPNDHNDTDHNHNDSDHN